MVSQKFCNILVTYLFFKLQQSKVHHVALSGATFGRITVIILNMQNCNIIVRDFELQLLYSPFN